MAWWIGVLSVGALWLITADSLLGMALVDPCRWCTAYTALPPSTVWLVISDHWQLALVAGVLMNIVAMAYIFVKMDEPV